MKNLISILLMAFSLSLFTASAAESSEGQFKLEKVTAYYSGAQLSGSVDMAIPEGESELLIKGVGYGVDPETLVVNTNEQVSILTTSVIDNYIVSSEQNSPQVQVLKDKIETLTSILNQLNIEKQLIDSQITLYQSAKIDQLNNAESNEHIILARVKFIENRVNELLTKQLDVVNQQTKLIKERTEYQNQLAQMGNSKTYTQVLKLRVYSDTAQSTTLNLSYLSTKVSWVPKYDVRIADLDKPLKLITKADISQNTGINWQGVDLSLLSSYPENAVLPNFYPKRVDYINNRASQPYYAEDSVSYEILASSKVNLAKAPLKDRSVQMENTGLAYSYQLDLPYTIPTGPETTTVQINAKEIQADYRTIVRPLLSDKAFLEANINDWAQLNLLPGTASIYYKGQLVNHSTINPNSVEDQLSFVIATDPFVIASIQTDKDLTSEPKQSAPIFGLKSEEREFAYTIQLNNTKSEPVTLTVQSQIPVIMNQQIKLDAEYGEAELNERTGVITWKVELKANEKKDLTYRYKVIYPLKEDMRVIGL